MAKNATLISTPNLAQWWLEWRLTPSALNKAGERPSIEAAMQIVEQRSQALARFDGSYFGSSAARHQAALKVLKAALTQPKTPVPTEPKTPPAEAKPRPRDKDQGPRQLSLGFFDFPI